MADSPERSRDHTLALIFLLENLGFIVHPEKAIMTPTQEIEFLGMVIPTPSLELRLPGRKIKKLWAEANKLESLEQPPSARHVSRVLGKMNAVSQSVPPAPLFYRHIQRDLARALEKGNQCYNTPCPLRGQVEWEVPPTEETGFDNRIRRLTYRVGSHFARCQDGGPLVLI